MNELIRTNEDVLNMLDSLLQEHRKFQWDKFYSDRNQSIPFFVNAPDESLVENMNNGILKPGRALDLGCGPGRNSIYLAKQGWDVDAVDLSSLALQWAEERAKEAGVGVHFQLRNLLELELEPSSYDLVYDSGCFHHLPPHRREQYINLVNTSLRPGGHFAITCFQAGGKYGGAEMSDWDVYRGMSLRGGLGFTEEKLTAIFHNFDVIQLREMHEIEQPSSVFGSNALLAGLFRKWKEE